MKKIKDNIKSSLPLANFRHMFNDIESYCGKGFYFIAGDSLKDHVYRGQIYFVNESGNLFYFSIFNEWKRSKNEPDFFINLVKLV